MDPITSFGIPGIQGYTSAVSQDTKGKGEDTKGKGKDPESLDSTLKPKEKGEDPNLKGKGENPKGTPSRPSISDVTIYQSSSSGSSSITSGSSGSSRSQTQEGKITKRITPLVYQVSHLQEAIEILRKYPVFMSASETRTGKTYITGALYQRYRFKRLLVIGSSPCEGTWKKFCKEFDIPYEFYSYRKISGVSDKQPNHPYLTRQDTYTKDKKGNKVKTTQFFPTLKFLEYVNDKTLLVIDEAHHGRNKSAQSFAVEALTSTLAKAVMSGEVCKSRVVFLSATPFYKPASCERFLQFFGVLPPDGFCTYDRSEKVFIPDGLDNLIKHCKYLDPETTANVIEDMDYYGKIYKRKHAEHIGWELYSNVVSPALVRSMIRTPLEGECTDHKIIKLQMYLKPEEQIDYLAGVRALADATRYRDGNVDMQDGIEAVIAAMMKIEKAKAKATQRTVRRFMSMSNNKVIVYHNYLEHLHALEEIYASSKPVVITGEAKHKRCRQESIDAFQLSSKRRLLLTTLGSGSESVSFHDAVGGYPRVSLINPSYNFLALVQAVGRVNCPGVKSPSVCYILFGKTAPGVISEVQIIEAMARNSANLRKTYSGEYKEKAFLPEDYPLETEDDPK